jgi:hypothetical protein
MWRALTILCFSLAGAPDNVVRRSTFRPVLEEREPMTWKGTVERSSGDSCRQGGFFYSHHF